MPPRTKKTEVTKEETVAEEVAKPAPKQTKKKEPVVEETVVEETVAEEETTAKPRSARMKVNATSVSQEFENLLNFVSSKIEKLPKNDRTLVSIRLKLTKLSKHLNRVLQKQMASEAKKSNASTTGIVRASGFDVKYNISKELQEFLGVTGPLSRTEVTKAICVYIRVKEDETPENLAAWGHLNKGGHRNLQNPTAKATILPDAALSKLLSYDDYKKQVANREITRNKKDKATGLKETVVVTDPVLHYYGIQSLLKRHFLSAANPKTK